MLLSISDNCRNGKLISELVDSANALPILADLKKVANKSLKELCSANSNLLVFPAELNSHKDGIYEAKILEISGADSEAKICTSNLMGFIGVGDTELKIRSRFDAGDCDHFLHYMLQRVFKVNLFDFNLKVNAEKDNLDLLYFIFPVLLNKAMSKGIFRKYKTFSRNDVAVKGPINISRHIQNNIPFNGEIAYNSREFCYDNEVTELIRHTIEVIYHSEFGKNIFRDKIIKENVSRIIQATPAYKKSDRQKIIAQNKQPLAHSFFLEYGPLQKLCKMILQRKTLSYKPNKNEIYGILFDGAWLWEEYLGTILCEMEFIHPKNKEKSGGIYLFEKHENSTLQLDAEIDDSTYRSRYRRYPDFYKRGEFILDAKYKRLDKGSIARDDMHQIIAYMYAEKAMKGGLIYPTSSYENLRAKPLGTLRGYGGSIMLYGLPIPQKPESENFDFSEFKKAIAESENSLRRFLDRSFLR